jgi:hypothetical protein
LALARCIWPITVGVSTAAIKAMMPITTSISVKV